MDAEMPVSPTRVYADDSCELWHANALDHLHVGEVMAGRRADAVIVDAPYSEKTHAGHMNGKLTADRAAAWVKQASSTRAKNKHERDYAARKSAAGESGRRDIEYAAWSPADVTTFCALWTPVNGGWLVSITDDVLAPAWAMAAEREGLYRFAPLPLVETGSRVRMTGDGPSNWTCWIVVARPKTREFASWGTLPGAYVQPAEREINSSGGSDRIVGGKPLRSMCGIVRDYSRPGALVLDPCCGAGTTLLAAKMQRRRAIGLDVNREHLAIAARRLAVAREQRELFGSSANA